MTEKQVSLAARLIRLGFTKGNQMKLYGEVFEFVSEPIVMADNVVLVDRPRRGQGQSDDVPHPLPIVHMVNGERTAA